MADLHILDSVMTKAYGDEYEVIEGFSSTSKHETKRIILFQVFNLIVVSSYQHWVVIFQPPFLPPPFPPS